MLTTIVKERSIRVTTGLKLKPNTKKLTVVVMPKIF